MSAISKSNSCAQSPRGIMTRLAKDKRGATLPMMAAAVIPIAAMVGAGLDMSRVVLVRTRLQQACDAGAVAVRRSMSATNSSTATDANKIEGYKFFDFNFPASGYGTSAISRSYTGETGTDGVGNVNGQASASVPTSIMKLFAVDTMSVAVSCGATLNIPNTDVMFVLDISGSMNDTAGTDTISKLAGLKIAVKDFYSTLGKGTNEGAGRIRYGFVPYSSNANVGAVVKAAPGDYITGEVTGETAAYRSRTVHMGTEYYEPDTYKTESSHSSNGTTSNTTPTGSSYTNLTSATPTSVGGNNYTNLFTGISSSTCSSKSKPYSSASPQYSVDTLSGPPSTPNLIGSTTPTHPNFTRTNSYTKTENYNRKIYGYVWTRNLTGNTSIGTCQFQYLNQTFTRTIPTKTTQDVLTWKTRPAADGWTYNSRSIDVSSIVAGNSITSPVTWSGPTLSASINANPSYNSQKPALSQQTIPASLSWSGCLEESRTVATITATSAIGIPVEAKDMQIDLKPTALTDKWKPYLPAVVFDSNSSNRWQGDGYWQSIGYAACPSATKSAAVALAKYVDGPVAGTNVSTNFAEYVDELIAIGGTQHDLGMIWGARLLSPDGIMSSENSNSTAPGGFAIGRHLVFMTDGNMDSRKTNYGPWGIAGLEGRQYPTSTNDISNSSQEANNIHYQRMKMICNAAKSKGFTIWVVGFGIAEMPLALQECATDADHWALATKSADLKTEFKKIAGAIGGLRLSQ
jgi:Flp pilus assembly protein TadG